jgi:thiol:disulfide interchange protein DsbD
MSRFPRARLLLAVPALLAAAWAALPARAGDKVTGRIDMAASVVPADLAPGGHGVLKIHATFLSDKHYLHAAGEEAMTYEPVPAPGVTYDMKAVQLTKPHEMKDEVGDTMVVWEGSFDFEVPVTLAADAAPDTELGVSFTYYGCVQGVGCYPPVKGQVAKVKLGGASGSKPVSSAPSAAKGAPGKAGATPVPPGAAAAPDEGPKGQTVLDASATVRLGVDEAKGEAVVTLTPDLGYHLYGPDDKGGNVQVQVHPVAAEGVTWGTVHRPEAGLIEGPYEVRVPFTRKPSVRSIAVRVTWQACQGEGPGASCALPGDRTLRATWGAAAPAPKQPAGDATPPPIKEGDVLFPYVDARGAVAAPTGDEGGKDKTHEGLWGLLGLYLGAFGTGILLAFTPCVLPIIPITVSVITGGRADVPKGRLTALLLTYVGGLAATFAVMGVAAALAGGSLSGAFTNPWVISAIVLVFLALAFSMIGIYELQPPAWLMNLQGGAQRRSGSLLGALLFGCLGAIIASPCTGPAIAGLLVLTAKSGDVVLGFTLFFTLGLGMGAVFFAAGALNFALRPGPWMVWVRYVFGMLLFGAAIYYMNDLVWVTWGQVIAFGSGICVLAMLGVAWHLVKKEGEERKPALVRGAQVMALFVLTLVLVGWYVKPVETGLEWTFVRDRDHLVSLVDEAKAEGRPVLVDFWAKWCHYCKEYDKLIADHPELIRALKHVKLVKVDLTKDAKRWGLRHAVGQKAAQQPYMVILDKQGRIVRQAIVDGWLGAKKGPAELMRRLEMVLPPEVLQQARVGK